MSADDLRAHLDAGRLKRDGHVRQNSQNGWTPISRSVFSNLQSVTEGPRPGPFGPDADWHYTHKGNQTGPVPREEIERLVKFGYLDSSAYVWQVGTPDWLPLSQSTFDAAPKTPPLASHLVTNGIVWTLAFLPLIYAVFDAVIIQMRAQRALQGDIGALTSMLANPNDSGVPIFVYWVINIALCFWDQTKVEKAGYPSNSWLLVAILFVPAYLFVRAKAVNDTPYYGFVWLACFALSVLT